MRSQRQYIQDILDAVEAAEEFVEDSRFEDLEGSLEKQFALQRAFEVIGEATKQLDPSIRARYSDVPWEDMAGMRDVLIHQYFAVDLEVVWDTIHNRFPTIKSHLRRILSDLDADE
ncbi:HepT-like ribonuclease domain-containing protein [Salinibacter ruber]|uniref:HepT-like ribonuclease domain-containing protein n=1 Tax=Salinibacter ruber TaxID=146919 RepID=UPI00216A2A11|nr:DUF86 domain-containing protein [Salinibacter ruber]MCS4133525.1 uncharacterized protein with HEPN domain [Salinibacter ruber]